MKTSGIARALEERTCIGAWAMMGSPTAVEAMALAGLDFIILDLEHGLFDFECLVNCVRAIQCQGGKAIVRTMDTQEHNLLKCLESKPDGILIPHVESFKTAEKVVQSCYYSPDGTRGLSPYTRVHGFDHQSLKASLERANHELFVGVLVEGPNGVRDVEKMAQIPGLDLVYFGIYDFTNSMGFADQVSHPEVERELRNLVATCKSKGMHCGTFGKSSDDAEKYHQMGISFLATGCDSLAITSYFSNEIKLFRSKVSIAGN